MKTYLHFCATLLGASVVYCAFLLWVRYTWSSSAIMGLGLVFSAFFYILAGLIVLNLLIAGFLLAFKRRGLSQFLLTLASAALFGATLWFT